MRRYAHVFFDLDHTLWDFRSNSRDTLLELHGELRLADEGITDAGAFLDAYEEINAGLWSRYEQGRMDKEVLRVLRFRNTLRVFGVRNDRLATILGHEYLERCPRRPKLHDGAVALLSTLEGRVRMHIITNGFSGTQRLKLECSRLAPWFDIILTSEDAGARKPDPRIFRKAMEKARCSPTDALMVGDSAEADMAGARGVGMDQAHFTGDGARPDDLATYRVTRLLDVAAIVL